MEKLGISDTLAKEKGGLHGDLETDFRSYILKDAKFEPSCFLKLSKPKI